MTKFHRSRKNILYLSVYDPHVPLTGGGIRGAEFVNKLAQHFDLDLIYIDGAGQPSIPELSSKYLSKVKGVKSKTCIPFRRFDYFIFSRKLYCEAKRLAKGKKYSFVICDYGLSAIYGILLQKKFGIPFVYCSHNIEYLMYFDKIKKDKRRLLLLPYVYWVEKSGVRKSKILVAITKIDAEHYGRWVSKEKILVIPQCFDPLVFNPHYEAPKNNLKIILFCGNYNIQQNRDVVYTVREFILQKVVSNYPEIKFVFVGANPPQDINHPNIEFTGFVPDYPLYLKQADIVISPMLQGRGFPTKIIESIACGKPTLATPVGARSLERDYKALHICEIENFSTEICRLLMIDEPVTTRDHKLLTDRYSWDMNLQNLVKRLREPF